MAERIQSFTDLRHPARVDGYLDVLQMLSGAILILFMWGHMVLVASVNLGSGVMNAIAEFLEDTYMVQSAGPVIALIFLFHFLLAARKVPFRGREQSIMARHSLRLQHGDTWLWIIQVATALFILVLGTIHMWTVLTDLPITAGKSAARVQRGWWLAGYLVLLPMVELHVGIGFYRIGVKWGWIKRSTRRVFKGVERKMTIAFIIIGVITLTTFFFFIEAQR